MSVPAQYVYRYQDGKVTKSPSEIRPLASKEILLKITHSSLCGTDLTYAGSGIALGHEGVGIVAEIGSEVTHLKVGDRAGGGYHRHSCGQCSYCLGGQDIWCYNRVVFGEGDTSNGTFATFYVAHETYLHRIPDSLPSEYAAPLQCAGATVYSAVVATVKPTQRVGIVGIGGLGHLAIQFASKMGAEVVVFSSSKNKEGEARGFGASEFYLTNEPERITTPVDVLVVAGNRNPDWSK